MAMKKRKSTHKRGSFPKKGKKKSKSKSPQKVQNIIQDENCKNSDANNIFENEFKQKKPNISRTSESKQSIIELIQKENLLTDTVVKNPEELNRSNQLNKDENFKIQSLGGQDHWSKFRCSCEENPKNPNTNSRGDDNRWESSYVRDNLKDDNDEWNSALPHHNDNGWMEIGNKKIENRIMNEVLSYKNIRINPEAISIFIVDNTPRHPSHLGDIPWSLLNEEKWRLHTFSRYPYDAPKSAILLAAEGFAYIGTGRDSDDSVICYFCEAIKKKWHPLDDIPQVHEQISPNCSFVTKINCTNVPLETSFNDSTFCQLFTNSINNKRGNAIQNKERPLSNNIKAPEKNIEFNGASPPLEDGGINRNGSSQIETDGASPSLVSVGTGRNEYPQISSSDIPNNYIASQASVNPNVTQQLSDRTSSSSLQNSGITAAQVTAPSSILHADSIVSHSATPSPQRPVSTHQSSVTAGQGSNTATTAPARTTSTTAQDVTAPATTTLTTTAPTTTIQTGTGANSNLARNNAGGPTYSELGIVTERPKRFEYALLAKRMETFLSWPRDHQLRPKELAEAGFYYAGYGDCARCFYCGGGLRNWEDEDDVWVEHARWFPKCAYIRQQMGQVFVDTVQELNKTNDKIFFTMVMEQIGHAASAFQLDSKDNPLKRDPAVKTVLDMGYPLAEVIAVAETIKEDGNILSSDKILEKLDAAKIKRNPNTLNLIPLGTEGTEASLTKDIETMRALKEKNNQLRQQTTCKICMDKEVAVVFLPCGHFVSCTDCASAMKDCPVCRNHVKGIVRAFIG